MFPHPGRQPLSGWLILTGVTLQLGNGGGEGNFQCRFTAPWQKVLKGDLDSIDWDRAALAVFPCHSRALNSWPLCHEPTFRTLRLSVNRQPPSDCACLMQNGKVDETAEAEVVLLPLSHFVSVHRSALPQATLYYRRSLLAAFTQLQLKVHFFLPLCLYLSHCSLSMQHSQGCPHSGCCRCWNMNPNPTPHTDSWNTDFCLNFEKFSFVLLLKAKWKSYFLCSKLTLSDREYPTLKHLIKHRLIKMALR